MNYQSHSPHLGQISNTQTNTTQIAHDSNRNTETQTTQQMNGTAEHGSNDLGTAESSETNTRLLELEKEIRELSSYGSACDELYTMLEEPSFLTKANETGLLKCVSAINEKANDYGPWSGIKILKELMSNLEPLSKQCQEHITRCYNELNETVFGIKPTPPTPTVTQKTVTSNNSVTSSNSVAAISIPSSPSEPASSSPSITSSVTALDSAEFNQIYNNLMGNLGRTQQQQQQNIQTTSLTSPGGGNNDKRTHMVTNTMTANSNHHANNTSNHAQYTSSMSMSQSDPNLYSAPKRQKLTQTSDYSQGQASSPRPQHQQQQMQPQRTIQSQTIQNNNQMPPQQFAQVVKQQQLQLKLQQQQQQQQQQAQQQAQQLAQQKQAQQLAQQRQAHQLAQQAQQQQLAQHLAQQQQQQQAHHLMQQQHRQQQQQQQQAYNTQLQYSQPNRNSYRAVEGYTANSTAYPNYDNPAVSAAQSQQQYQQYLQQLSFYGQRHYQHQHNNTNNNNGAVLLQPGASVYHTNNTSHPMTANNNNSNSNNNSPSQNPAVMHHLVTATAATNSNSNNNNSNNPPLIQQHQQQHQQPSMLSNNPPLSPTFVQLQKNQMNAVPGGSPRLPFAQLAKNQVNLPPQASPPSSPTTGHGPRYTAPSSPLTTQVQSPKQTHQSEANHPQSTISPRLMRTTAPSPNYPASVFMNPTQQQQQQQDQSSIQKPTQPSVSSQPSTPTQYHFQFPGQASQKPHTPAQPPPPPQASLPTPPQTIPQKLPLAQPNVSTTNHTPNETSTSFNNLQITLPGGGRPSRPLLESETAKFRSLCGQAIRSFQLDHGQQITRKPFFISRDEYSRLYYGSRTKEFIDPRKLPLTYILNSWHNDSVSTKCDWPAALKVQLNNRELTLEKRKKVIVPGRATTYSGKDRPYDLSGELKEGENTLIIFQTECACSYNFSIDIYQRESEDLIRHKAAEQVISLEKGQRLIDGLLGAVKQELDDDDIEIIQESIKLSLRCPISLLRIETPVKGIHCKHPNCFDISSFLQVNANGFTQWRCPHCNNTVIPSELATDKFFENLLNTLPKRVREIEFTVNHKNYKIIKADDETDDEGSSDEEGSTKKESSKPKFELVEDPANVISLLSDDED